MMEGNNKYKAWRSRLVLWIYGQLDKESVFIQISPVIGIPGSLNHLSPIPLFSVSGPARIDNAIYSKASFTKLPPDRINLRFQICLGRVPKRRSDTIDRTHLSQSVLALSPDLLSYMIQNLTDHAGICDRLRFTQCLQDHLPFQSNNERYERIEITGVGRL